MSARELAEVPQERSHVELLLSRRWTFGNMAPDIFKSLGIATGGTSSVTECNAALGPRVWHVPG
jgi:hypothetical protein